MLFGLRTKPILDEVTVLWLFDTYAWALENFNKDNSFRESNLINPSNDHFPGRENSADAMANLIFTQVVKYSGMTQWPLELVTQADIESDASLAKRIQYFASLPAPGTQQAPSQEMTDLRIPVPYNPYQLGNPQALIAEIAHALAMYQGSQALQPPPGGEENWPHVTEVLAVYKGFGVMLANSAFNVRVSSCGSCQGPANDRSSYLSQYDVTYALAIFSVLKNISNKHVFKYLKKSLHSFYKKAIREIENNETGLARLRALIP